MQERFSRLDFIKGSCAVLGTGMFSMPSFGAGDGAENPDPRAIFQREIDIVTPEDYRRYLDDGDTRGFKALDRLEKAFDKVYSEALSVKPTDKPAIWLVYNLGCIVKTKESLFSIDLVHRREAEFAKHLDFSLITHNHCDHWRQNLYRAMDGSGKTVVSNFLNNYGAKKNGGYVRGTKTFKIRDVEISTMLVDHNKRLVDFTTAYEIRIGDFTIFHSGDCSSHAKFKLKSKSVDVWLLHPRCGLKPEDAAQVVKPKLSAISHLNELLHAKGRWRWTWKQGESHRRTLGKAGYKAVVPLWGDRIV